MGISFSWPFTSIDDLDRRLESIISKTFTFNETDVKTLLRSISFNDRDRDSTKLTRTKSLGSNQMVRGSLSFNGKALERFFSFESPSAEEDHTGSNHEGQVPEPKTNRLEPPSSTEPDANGLMNRDIAAVKLQKTYKSFRTRRQLADCAVLVEQRWWKLLDFALLKCSSVSFFEVEKQETAVSRWSRARTRAAKVGKGLSKNAKARKLALQHWLEAIDPRHRYGHNLQFYYTKWLHCQSRQPFFYWLDIGEGKEVNLERCPRPKLHQQCIKYLGPTEREAYEVTVEDGKFMYKQNRALIDTRGGPTDAKWIFVLSTSMVLYIGLKQKGKFQHSSFLAGGATLSAGRLVVVDGTLKAVWPHSGHYLPTEENFDAFISFLEQHHVDLQAVKKSPDDEDEEAHNENVSIFGLRNSLSEPDICQETESRHYSRNETKSRNSRHGPHQPLWRGSKLNIMNLEIPNRENIVLAFRKKAAESRPAPEPGPGPESDGYDTAEESLWEPELSVSKRNLFDYGEEAYDEPVSREKIMKRINSHKETKSFQLARQLSCRWSTGAGPRIGCVRDYPSELQVRALEEVCLSPRGPFASPRRFGHATTNKSPLSLENSC